MALGRNKGCFKSLIAEIAEKSELETFFSTIIFIVVSE
jgi:hypothetical protein